MHVYFKVSTIISFFQGGGIVVLILKRVKPMVFESREYLNLRFEHFDCHVVEITQITREIGDQVGLSYRKKNVSENCFISNYGI